MLTLSGPGARALKQNDQHSLFLHDLPKKGSSIVVGICRHCSRLSQLVLMWLSPTPLRLPLTLANTQGQQQAALAAVTPQASS